MGWLQDGLLWVLAAIALLGFVLQISEGLAGLFGTVLQRFFPRRLAPAAIPSTRENVATVHRPFAPDGDAGEIRGKILFGGEIWQAAWRLEAPPPSLGSEVVVDDVEGLVAVVQPIPDDHTAPASPDSYTGQASR